MCVCVHGVAGPQGRVRMKGGWGGGALAAAEPALARADGDRMLRVGSIDAATAGDGAAGTRALAGRREGGSRRRTGRPLGLLPRKRSVSPLGTTKRIPFASGPDLGAGRSQPCPPIPPLGH